MNNTKPNWSKCKTLLFAEVNEENVEIRGKFDSIKKFNITAALWPESIPSTFIMIGTTTTYVISN